MGLRLWGDRHHEADKMHRTGGTILLVRVAKLHWSNYSLERMYGAHGQEAYFTDHRSIRGR